MDCRMPVMDGVESSRSIRALVPGAESLTIIGTSASTETETEHRCLSAGMNGYPPKPISRQSPGRILDSIEKQRGVQ